LNLKGQVLTCDSPVHLHSSKSQKCTFPMLFPHKPP